MWNINIRRFRGNSIFDIQGGGYMWQLFPLFASKSTFAATKCSLDLGRIRRNFKNADLDIKTRKKFMSKMKKSEKNHTVFSRYPPGVYLFASSFIISSSLPPPPPPQATLRTSSAAPEEICLSSYSSAKAPVSSSSLSVLFLPRLCYTTLLDVRIGCQNRIASSKNQKRNHNQMT